MTTDFEMDRRTFLAGAGAVGATLAFGPASAQSFSGPQLGDRVFLTNEDSNTLSVINPMTDTVEATVNLTSFDEDPRPPFRFVTGGMTPTHGAMVQKPLYHGAISIHGCAPAPDSNLLVTAGRGTSNLYLIDTRTLKVIGNTPNPQAGPNSNPEGITSGVLVGREPHEPTFTRTGNEIWVAVRGENKIVVVDVEKAKAESAGTAPRGSSLRRSIPVLPGPAMVWFSQDGRIAYVISQKMPRIDIFDVSYDAAGYSTEKRKSSIDITAADKFGFSPFLKRDPGGAEIWMTHKLADAVSVLPATGEPKLLETIALGDKARPNHVEFVENKSGRAAYVTFARIDDDGPGGVASSRIGVIDRAAVPGSRKIVGTFFSHGRDAHGVWSDPAGTKLYVAHEADELPNTPNAGQTVCSVFDITDVFKPRFVVQIPLGDLELPSGRLRNKKSINLVYVRPGARSATA